MFNPEKLNQIDEQESREKNAEKLSEYLEAMAEDLNDEGIPVTSDCRIDTKAFNKIYSDEELEKDEKEVARLKGIYAKENNLSAEEWEKKKVMKDGEQLEMLKTAIFHKNLSADFAVVRSSEYDDIKGGIDNVIINKKTGSVICAFDEGSPRKGEKYNKKREEIIERNKKDGVNLKYGITFKEEQEKPHLKPLDKLPIFLLALHPSEIQRGMEKFGEDTDFEKDLFKVFITEINTQINEMESESSETPPHLKEQWSDFLKFIEKES